VAACRRRETLDLSERYWVGLALTSDGENLRAMQSALHAAHAVPGAAPAINAWAGFLSLLRCPYTGSQLTLEDETLVAANGRRYKFSASGVALFAASNLTDDAKIQQAHYDTIADAYVANLEYPHTKEYTAYLDRAVFDALGDWSVGTAAEVCCGRGEAFRLPLDRITTGIGVDISLGMLESAQLDLSGHGFAFAQGDATRMPLADNAFDTVFTFGGIHHVPDRQALFKEIYRILKPGGRLIFREPVSDFLPWRALRAVVYRLSPILDHATERPLLQGHTLPVLEATGLRSLSWKTYGFIGFCLLMNSDVLFFNRPLRYLPGIRAITRAAARFDEGILRLPGMRGRGLQVVGVAEKPRSLAPRTAS
jgi:ubiquinone/menaquinone biosynthesis C-methylase UbiE